MSEEVKHNYTLRFMSQFNLVGVYVQGLFYHKNLLDKVVKTRFANEEGFVEFCNVVKITHFEHFSLKLLEVVFSFL